MASSYPASLDTFATNKANATATVTDHPAHHNDLADAVNKIEAELGVTPSGAAATVAARFGTLLVPRQVAYLAGRLSDETPHASDVFPSGASPGGTAYAISGTGVWGQEDNALSVVFNNQSAEDAAGRGYPISLSAPVTVETCVDLQMSASGVPHVGLGFTDGTAAGSNVAVAFLTHLTTPSFFYYSGTLTTLNAAFASASAAMQSTYARLYVRMIWKAANTFNAQWSPSGAAGSWTGFGLADQSKTMTPTHFGPIVTTWGGSEECVATYRYFRVADADLSA